MDRERCHHRFPVFGVRLRGPVFDAPVINLSKNGLAIRSDHELTPGDSYSAWLETEADQSRVDGTIIWCNPTADGRSRTRTWDAGLSVENITSGQQLSAVEQSPSAEPPAHLPVRSVPRLRASGMRLKADDLDAEVLNVSSRGLAIETDHPVAPGAEYHARLETNDGTVTLTAIVVWSAAKSGEEGPEPARYQAGLSFASPAPRATAPVPEAGESTQGAGDERGGLPAAGDVAPWLAEVTAELEAEGADGRGGWRRSAWFAGIAAVLALASAFWFSSRRSSEPAGTTERAPAVEAGSDAAATQPPTDESTSSDPELPAGSAAGGDAIGAAVERPQADDAEARGVLYPRPGVNLRGGPGLEHPVVRTTVEGERLPYDFEQGDWYRLHGEQELWIHGTTIERVVEGPEGA